MHSSARQTISRFIAENFLYQDGLASLADDTSLLESGIIDSTGIMELVMFLEQTFQIRVEDSEIVPDNLDSLTQLTAYIGRKLAGRGQQTGVCHAL